MWFPPESAGVAKGIADGGVRSLFHLSWTEAPANICPPSKTLAVVYKEAKAMLRRWQGSVFARWCCKLLYLGSDRSLRGEGNDSLVFGDVIPSLVPYGALGARCHRRPLHRPITLGVVVEHSEWVEVGSKLRTLTRNELLLTITQSDSSVPRLCILFSGIRLSCLRTKIKANYMHPF